MRVHTGRRERKVHEAGLCLKVQGATLLLVEGPHFRGSSAVREGELAGGAISDILFS